MFCFTAGSFSDKAIYEDVDQEALLEWAAKKKDEASDLAARCRQSCSTVSDDSEQWPDDEAGYSDDEDVLDVESADFDVASEDSLKSNELPAYDANSSFK